MSRSRVPETESRPDGTGMIPSPDTALLGSGAVGAGAIGASALGALAR